MKPPAWWAKQRGHNQTNVSSLGSSGNAPRLLAWTWKYFRVRVGSLWSQPEQKNKRGVWLESVTGISLLAQLQQRHPDNAQVLAGRGRVQKRPQQFRYPGLHNFEFRDAGQHRKREGR